MSPVLAIALLSCGALIGIGMLVAVIRGQAPRLSLVAAHGGFALAALIAVMAAPMAAESISSRGLIIGVVMLAAASGAAAFVAHQKSGQPSMTRVMTHVLLGSIALAVTAVWTAAR